MNQQLSAGVDAGKPDLHRVVLTADGTDSCRSQSPTTRRSCSTRYQAPALLTIRQRCDSAGRHVASTRAKGCTRWAPTSAV